MPAQVPDSPLYCPSRLHPYWDFLKELSAFSSLIRCNYISSELRYIKHYFWRSGIFFPPLCCFLLLLLSLCLFERDTTPLWFSFTFFSKHASKPATLDFQQKTEFHEHLDTDSLRGDDWDPITDRPVQRVKKRKKQLTGWILKLSLKKQDWSRQWYKRDRVALLPPFCPFGSLFYFSSFVI